LIASVAIANGLEVLQQDRDFDRIAAATGSLEIA
jgi:predicted nucleic acid-binding protein